MYKLSLSTGFSCPNRDGTLGTGGCAFCNGAGSFSAHGSIPQQLEEARQRLMPKLPKTGEYGYIAYFQSFTNTYGSLESMEEMFSAAVRAADVEVLSVATRPDCLPSGVLALLKELAQEKPVWIELGLQTANERTAGTMNRCFSNECYLRAVDALHQNGLEVITHLILGLPGDTEEDLLSSVQMASQSEGVKLQLLHLLRGTRLAEAGCETLSMEEYFRLVALCLEHLPKETVIHRLTGDGDKRELLAPLWSGDKHAVLNRLAEYLKKRDIVQGSKFFL